MINHIKYLINRGLEINACKDTRYVPMLFSEQFLYTTGYSKLSRSFRKIKGKGMGHVPIMFKKLLV